MQNTNLQTMPGGAEPPQPRAVGPPQSDAVGPTQSDAVGPPQSDAVDKPIIIINQRSRQQQPPSASRAPSPPHAAGRIRWFLKGGTHCARAFWQNRSFPIYGCLALYGGSFSVCLPRNRSFVPLLPGIAGKYPVPLHKSRQKPKVRFVGLISRISYFTPNSILFR